MKTCVLYIEISGVFIITFCRLLHYLQVGGSRLNSSINIMIAPLCHYV